MPHLLLVMIGGAIGAALRYEVGRIALHRIGPDFPWGTLIVNLTGGLFMGMLTTLSAFSFDLFAMLERGQIALASVYAGGSMVGSVALLFIGFWLARATT
jgi:CrcB protein